MKIKKAHYFGGMTMTIFIVFHLFNHVISVCGADAHIAMMEIFRIVYRNVFVESIILIAAILQIITGVTLFVRYRKAKNRFYRKLQLWTGMYLAFFLAIHIGAVLAGRYILELDTNFYFGVAGLNTFPINLFFIPYYNLAIISFFGHLAAIHAQKMKKKVFGHSATQQAKFILFIGFVLTLITLYGLTNAFNGVEIPAEYHVLIGK